MRLRGIPVLLAAALMTIVLVPLATAEAEGVPPPGANDWSCEPGPKHPQPVVLVHGTFENMAKNWSVLSPRLKDAGYCVFALNYGNNATGPIEDSAAELAAFVDRVRDATDARKVDLVGHSQGGMMPRYYLKFLGGTPEVDDLVGIVPSNHGTTAGLAEGPDPVGACPACEQQEAGSDFLTHLNAGDETPGNVDYTVITTKYDKVVTPYTSAFLAGPAAHVTNITLQDYCPNNTIGHDQSPNHPEVAQWVSNALERAGPADPSFQPACVV